MCLFNCSSKLIFSSAGKRLLLLREEWKYLKPRRRGAEPSPVFILALYSGSHERCSTPLLRQTGRWYLLPACFLPLLSHGVEDYLSAGGRTCINVQHSLGFELLLRFELQGQLRMNLCQSCQAEKHKTKSPHRGSRVNNGA